MVLCVLFMFSGSFWPIGCVGSSALSLHLHVELLESFGQKYSVGKVNQSLLTYVRQTYIKFTKLRVLNEINNYFIYTNASLFLECTYKLLL